MIDPNDYTIEHVELYVANAHGMTLDQVLALDFPPADYTDENDAPVWRHGTVVAWLGGFHAALITTERAQDPGSVSDSLDLIGDLQSRKEEEGGES